MLTCVALMVIDRTSGDDSPIAPVRRVVDEVLGPAQAGVSTVLDPLVRHSYALHTNSDLRDQIDDLEAASQANAVNSDEACSTTTPHRLAELRA